MKRKQLQSKSKKVVRQASRSQRKQQMVKISPHYKRFAGLCLAVRLVAIADTNGMGVVDILECPNVLKSHKLSKDDIPRHDITKALEAESEITSHLRHRTWKLNSTWNGRYSPERERERAAARDRDNSDPTMVIDSTGKKIVRPTRRRGESAKDRIFKLWHTDQDAKPEDLLKSAEASVQLSTVRSWTRQWGKGQALPTSAKGLETSLRTSDSLRSTGRPKRRIKSTDEGSTSRPQRVVRMKRKGTTRPKRKAKK